MSRTLADLIMNDESKSFYTRDDWSRLGSGLLSPTEESDILAEGYGNIMDSNDC